MVMLSGAEATETLPALSVWVAVSALTPAEGGAGDGPCAVAVGSGCAGERRALVESDRGACFGCAADGGGGVAGDVVVVRADGRASGVGGGVEIKPGRTVGLGGVNGDRQGRDGAETLPALSVWIAVRL